MASVEVESTPVVEVKTTYEDAQSTQAIEILQGTLHTTTALLEEPANKVDAVLEEPAVAPVITEEVKNEVVVDKPAVEDPIEGGTPVAVLGDEKAIDQTANVAPDQAAEEVKAEGLEEKVEEEPVAVPALEEEKPIEEPTLTEEVKVEVVEEKPEQEPSTVEPTTTTNDLKVENVEVKSGVFERNTEEEEEEEEKNVVL